MLRKGEYDIISNGDVVYKLGVRGSPRRCGGQGDILAGCLGVALHWALMVRPNIPLYGFMSSYGNIIINTGVRECAREAV